MSEPSGAAPRPAAEGPPRRLTAAAIPDFVALRILAPSRKLPIVAITTSAATGRPWVDPQRAADLLGSHAEVVVIETGEATWALTQALPDMLDVYGGAVRIWWPGLTRRSDPHDHPLLFARSPAQGRAVLRRVAQAVLPAADLPPTPWERVAREYAVGDVVWGVVQGIRPFGVFVELLPGVNGLVRKPEVDWTYVRDPGAFVALGAQIKVQILHLDAPAQEALLSIKRALLRQPRSPLAPEPGGRPLLDPEGDEGPGPAQEDPGAAAALRDEIETLREERGHLLRRLRAAQKELRGTRDRLARAGHRPGSGDDALASGRAFLLGVRLAYARLFGEGERRTYPLARMRVGSQFLARVRAMDGVPVEKLLEVCAQVAAGRAREIPGREVHLLGQRGAPKVTRGRDGATAWRCSLQDNTAGARRLHWWQVPGPEGGVVEFASVGLHDDFGIPR
jgi:predicted RNA-binding protein with RPS1 domain